MKIVSFAVAISIFVLSTVLHAEDDPLGTPEMKKFAKGAVELGWKYFDKGDYDTALKRFQIATIPGSEALKRVRKAVAR